MISEVLRVSDARGSSACRVLVASTAAIQYGNVSARRGLSTIVTICFPNCAKNSTYLHSKPGRCYYAKGKPFLTKRTRSRMESSDADSNWDCRNSVYPFVGTACIRGRLPSALERCSIAAPSRQVSTQEQIFRSSTKGRSQATLPVRYNRATTSRQAKSSVQAHAPCTLSNTPSDCRDHSWFLRRASAPTRLSAHSIRFLARRTGRYLSLRQFPGESVGIPGRGEVHRESGCQLACALPRIHRTRFSDESRIDSLADECTNWLANARSMRHVVERR